MLAKKKSQKQKAIAAAAVAERRKEISRLSKRQRSDTEDEDPQNNTNNNNNNNNNNKDRRERNDTEFSNKPLMKGKRADHHSSASHAVASGQTDPSAVLRAIGDHVNTRLQELDFDDDIDADLFDDEQRKLREEAALAAGTKSRVLSKNIAAILQTNRKQTGDGVTMFRVGHNSNAVTAVCSFGSDVIILGDKSGAVYIADFQKKRKSSAGSSPHESAKCLLQPSLPGAILSIAVSDTRGLRPSQRSIFERSTVDTSITSYIAASAADGSIGVWITETRQHVGLLLMHRTAVTGLTFRHDTLYSCSHDETLRVWSVPQMTCQDKLFGHQGRVLGINCLKRERCATVGEDGTMRFWKVDAATQQEFTSSAHFGVKVVLECVAMMNDSVILCGATNGSLLVFDVARRKPLVVCEAAHGSGFVGDGTGLEKETIFAGPPSATCATSATSAAVGAQSSTDSLKKDTRRQNPNPITAVAAIPYSDVAASASYDGIVRLWRLTMAENTNTNTNTNTTANRTHAIKDSGETAKTKFECFASIPIDAIVTSLYFPPTSDVLVIGCGKEPRLGRWVVLRRALNAAYVVPLSEESLKAFQTCAHVEHIPAMLYGLEGHANEEEEGREKDNDEDKKNKEEEDGNEEDDEDDDDDEEEVSPPFGDHVEEDTGMFTVGDDGQLEFNPPLKEPYSATHEQKTGALKKNNAMKNNNSTRKMKSNNSNNNNKKKGTKMMKRNEGKKSKVAAVTDCRVKTVKTNTTDGKVKLNKKKGK